MTDKGSNLFDECATEYEHLLPQEEKCTSSSWMDSNMCTPSTPCYSNKNGAVAKVRILVELGIL